MTTTLKINDDARNVFIDTSIFEGENFFFGGNRLSGLLNACKEGTIALVLTDVTINESKRRIRKNIAQARAGVQSIKQATRIYSNSAEWRAIKCGDFDKKLESQIVAQFDEFIRDSKATILSVDDVQASEVFKRYFDCKPPFSIGKKEKEFPDAFAIEALISFDNCAVNDLYVVSADKDFEAACKDAGLHHIDELRTLLELAIGWSLSTREALIAECHSWVDFNIGDILDRIKAALKSAKYILDAPAGRILSFDVADLELDSTRVIELTEEKAVITAIAVAYMPFRIEYDALDEPYYDLDDRLIFPYENVEEELQVDCEFEVTIDAKVVIPHPTEIVGLSISLSELMIEPKRTSYSVIS